MSDKVYYLYVDFRCILGSAVSVASGSGPVRRDSGTSRRPIGGALPRDVAEEAEEASSGEGNVAEEAEEASSGEVNVAEEAEEASSGQRNVAGPAAGRGLGGECGTPSRLRNHLSAPGRRPLSG